MKGGIPEGANALSGFTMITTLSPGEAYKLKESNLCLADKWEVNRVLEDTKAKRDFNRCNWTGKTKDGDMHSMCNIPAAIYYSEWFMKMFPPWMPQEEFTKESRKWLAKNPQFKLLD